MSQIEGQELSWLEKKILGDLRVWQIIFLTFGAFMTLTIALCCCIKFRVPRTKQQIEANYQRRIITQKFRQQLEKIQNSQMDSIDLKTALEIIRCNLKSDLESEKDPQQSVSLMSSIVSPVQSLDEASLKSSHTMNNKQQAEPQLEVNTGIKKLGSKFSALVSTFKQRSSVKNDIY